MTAPLIIAGACGYGAWPANSAEGARACNAAPVDGIEIDVHLTADGHVVAHHDYRFAPESTRLDGQWLEAPGPLLRDSDLSALRAYDLGRDKPGSAANFLHPQRQGMDGVTLPTLPDVLAVLAEVVGPRRKLFVEIKTDPAEHREGSDPVALLDAVLRDLDRGGWMADSKIIAFDWSVLRDLKAKAPRMPCAHLTVPDSMKPKIRRLANGDSPWNDGFDPRHYGGSELRAIAAHGGQEWSPHKSDVTLERVVEARDLGLSVGVWGISTAAEIDALMAFDIHALTVSGPAWGR